MLKLEDLPHFEIESIAKDGKEILLHGCFNHLTGVADRGWLYLAREMHRSPEVAHRALDHDSLKAVLHLQEKDVHELLRPGERFPYFHRRWDPRHVSLALNSELAWNKIQVMSDDTGDSSSGASGWQPAGEKLIVGAQFLESRKDGPDHENCSYCFESLGPNEIETHGYKNDVHDDWVCQSCFDKYIVPHDLSFLIIKDGQ
jgi:hypothetical protein